MNYLSTRNNAENQSFATAVLNGLAPDGGLYIPQSFPDFDWQAWQGLSYQTLATEVFSAFMSPELSRDVVQQMVNNAYQTFSEPDVTPLKRYDDRWVLELFHGPTLAFKDVALQFLGEVLTVLLKNSQKNLCVLGATSGDTGGAAIAGLAKVEQCRVFMLYPEGRVSAVQEWQMTRNVGRNVFPIAIDGAFDDAQAIVKSLFVDPEIRDQLQLTAVNSINWCRIMAQMVYYFSAALQLSSVNKEQTNEPFSFAVPTGNFGDVLAGYYAKRCGLPVKKFIVACNDNDILYRLFTTGVYQPQSSHLTLSPAMDIQVASNFERLLFELSGRDAAYIKEKMQQLEQDGQFTLEADVLDAFKKEFEVIRVSDQETEQTLAAYTKRGFVIDPHTAVGIAAANKSATQTSCDNVICLSTAHPIKFAETVEKITSRALPMPESVANLTQFPETKYSLSNEPEAIKAFILSRSN